MLLARQLPFTPTQAADEGVEGFVHLEFTVDSTGSVDPGTIVVLDESPANVFTNSALAAAETLVFSPRVDNGEPVPVPGVQFVYRYELEE